MNNSIKFLHLKSLQVSCNNCSMQEICLPTGLNAEDIARLDQIIGRRRRIERGEHLYHANDPFKNLYAIRFGHFKTCQANSPTTQSISGFQMAGELLGMDALSTDRHHCDAVALEDSEVCEIPFAQLEELFRHIRPLLHHFHRIMGREITREHNAMLLLGNMRAEQRFAAFLINLSSRYAMRGYSATRFQLRMSREDIANYLGLTIESISRLLARLKKEGLLKVDRRELQLLDLPGLNALASGSEHYILN